MKVNDSVLEALEYNKILALLAERAASSLGRAASLALRPAADLTKAAEDMAETAEAFKVLAAAAPPFGGLTDIREIVKKAMLAAVISGREIVLVGQALYAVRRMREFFLSYAEPAPRLYAYAGSLTVLRRLEDELERAVDPEGGMRDGASPELARLRREVRVKQNRVKEKLEQILRSEEYRKYFQEQFVTMRGDRYVIPIRQEYRQFFPGIVHDQSGSGATVFIEPLAVVELNNDIKNLLSEEKEETERILQLLSREIGGSGDAILTNLAVMTRLDLLFAKARLAQDWKAQPPVLGAAGLSVRQARHPLIGADVVVPVDIAIDDNTRTLVITGSNAGGKTVALKIIGLFALMAQSGLFLPAAAQTSLPVFGAIYADIGDEQSIEQNLSTFSGQMKNIINILARADTSSLILFDEICAGTDPREGAALAMAVLEELMDRDALTVITTHYSELKVFAFQTAGMENASVEFDPVSLSPTYRLLMGTPGSSNAFYIAGRLGLSGSVVDRAKSLVDDEYRKLENIITGLEQERRDYEEKNRELDSLRRDAGRLRERLGQAERDLTAKKREVIDKCRNDAAEILRQARVEAETAIREIKAAQDKTDANARQQAIMQARRRLQATPDMEEEMPPGLALTKENALPGRWVYVPSLRQKGTIVGMSGEEVLLQMGLLKTSLPFGKCLLTEDAPGEKPTGGKPLLAGVERVANFKMELDLRGKTIEEAIAELDKYIDEAVLANAREVRIIHGKGTGALRRGLGAYFDRHPLVRGHELAALNQGGSGATVLFL